MAKNIAGRILIMPRGTYDANATYEMLDLVMYNNASWLAKKTATGIEPADGEYWHKMADGVELVTNLTTETEGKALDASMGKVLKELIDAVGADALRGRLDALEEASATHSDDINALRLAIEEFGNIDSSTVRYVSDETDENFDWVQVQDAEGNWVNFQRAYTQRYELYVNSNDGGEFGGYAIWTSSTTNTLSKPTLAKANTLTATLTSSNNTISGCVLSKKIDLSRFETLSFTQTSKSNNGNDQIYINFVIVQSLEKVTTPVVNKSIFKSATHSRERYSEETIDISSLNGEYYIGFAITSALNAYASIEVNNMYLE